MGFILSLFVIGAGAVLRYALNVEVDEINLNLVGTITMFVGAASAGATGINWARDTWFEAEEHEQADTDRQHKRDAGVAPSNPAQ